MLATFLLQIALQTGIPVLTEVHADPAIYSDNDAEFLEFQNRSNEIFSDTLLVKVNGKEVHRKFHTLNPRELLLLCSSQNSPWPGCDSSFHSLNLTNSSALQISAIIPNKKDSVSWNVPSAFRGVSQTHDFRNPAQNTFMLTSELFEQGEKCTPNQVDPLDPTIEDASLSWISTTENQSNFEFQFQVQTKNRSMFTEELKVYSDDNLDGLADDSVLQIDQNLRSENIRVIISKSKIDSLKSLLFILSKDEFLKNNQIFISLWNSNNTPIQISEICPFPQSGQGEWVEIQNRSSLSIDLANLKWRASDKEYSITESSHFLAPNSSAVITEDSTDFRSIYGKIRTMLVQPEHWSSFSNSGGAKALYTKQGLLLDSISWPSAKTRTENKGLISSKENPQFFDQISSQHPLGSPGITPAEKVFTNKLFLGNRVLLQHKAENLRIHVESGEEGLVQIELYDLEGTKVWSKSQKFPGSTVVLWNGRIKNHFAEAGIYLVVASFPQGKVLRSSFVVSPE